MVSVCFYFQVHQPFRIRKYSIFDIGSNHIYWDEKKNKEILERVSRKCYLPVNKIMLDWIKKYNVKISYSFSGVVLEQFEKYQPEVLKSFQELVKTGNVEILSETYNHSLAFLYSKEEFKKQVELHKKIIKRLFGVTPKIFRNTELIYNNEIAEFVEKLGYKGILLEGWDNVLGWRSPNFLYNPVNTSKIKALLKNYRLSDDIAFRFSTRGWSEWPLTAEKFANWLSHNNGNGNVVNLFMDYETFGEHQWEETGIFDFLRQLPVEILKHQDNDFKTPSEVVDSYSSVGEIDVPYHLSWADMERDVSAWLGNKMQQSAVGQVYEMENKILDSKDDRLIEDWRKLQTTDHFYYMCTKWFADGDVHKYFNPYDSPYDAFITYMNILGDLSIRLKDSKVKTKVKPKKKVKTRSKKSRGSKPKKTTRKNKTKKKPKAKSHDSVEVKSKKKTRSKKTNKTKKVSKSKKKKSTKKSTKSKKKKNALNSFEKTNTYKVLKKLFTPQ